MTQKHNIDDFTFPWQSDIFSKSQKNMNFTMSQISKSQFDSKLFPEQDYEAKQWNLDEFNKKAEKKMKNRNNVKNFRSRKKHQQQQIQKKIEELQQENRILKIQKYCRHCKRPFQDLIKIPYDTESNSTKSCLQNHSHGTNKCNQEFILQEKQSGFQFEKADLYQKVQKNDQKANRNGKIWIALGILMLVIGVHLYGFRGKQDYKQIHISKLESKKWIKAFQNRAQTVDNYLNVKLKTKQKQKQKQQQQNIFQQIKIFHEQGASSSVSQTQTQSKQKQQYQRQIKNTLKRFQMIDQDDGQDEQDIMKGFQKNNSYKSKTQNEQNYNEEQIQIHKQLLYAIHAEIEDIGNYV